MLVSVSEAGTRLGVHRSAVYRLIHAGRLRVVDVGTGGKARLRIREDDLQAFIEANTHDAPTETNLSALDRA